MKEIIEGGYFTNGVGDLITHNVEYKNCLFEHMDFSECSIINVSFINCQFSYCCFKNAYLQDVDFNASRFSWSDLTAMSFINAKINNAVFWSCKARFLKIENSSVENLGIENTEMHNSIFSSSHLINISAMFSFFLFAQFIKCNIINFKQIQSKLTMMEIDSDMDEVSTLSLTNQ